MSDSDPLSIDPFWERRFADLVLTSAEKADQRARSRIDRASIIENMEVKRILMQYGTDFLHMAYHLPLDAQGRERLFEAVAHNMIGMFLSGRLGAQQVSGQLAENNEPDEIEKVRSKTGPAPIKRDHVASQILDALRAGENLAGEKQEALAARFGASRGTVKAAYDQAVAVLQAENVGTTLTDSDKL